MEGQPSGGWGAGPDPPSVLMFLHYEVSNKRKSVVRRSYPLTIFLVSSSGVGQVPGNDQAERSGGVNELPHPLTWGYRVMTTCDQLWIGRGVGTSVSGRKSPSRLWLTGASFVHFSTL